MIEIKTKRLMLRPIAMKNAIDVTTALNNFEVAKYLSSPPYPYSIADAKEWIGLNEGASVPENTNFAVTLLNGEYCGGVGFDGSAEHPELGFYIAEPKWGNGYVSEAASAAIEWLFANANVTAITSGAYSFNPASLAVQAKLGFQETGTEERMCNAQARALPMITTILHRKSFKKLH
ncbi:GNAT family N-acetyltransferase [Maritalea porphyrae]|jgi:RimJ/RimL family protein N-acetyltransferase|uniref:GNAT family N-acetyltransferase n=1 Tax=Maritalea porphyrae TaxID=880732 RepID=UPI0022AF0A92|nr:GNAT family N-acetyltransferase [Maritalea porphyrae]MCZ4271652.1 GNAT family N-acetyltransferase [Maritalea porphyrae]